MLRLLALAGLVAACGPPPSGLSPDDAYEAAWAAADRGDVRRALGLLDEAADAGHLAALGARAEAASRGYLRTRGGAPERNLAYLPWPGEASRTAARYDAALRDSVRAGHSDALYLALDDVLGRGGPGSEPARADRDSADALYRRLVQTGRGTLGLAFVAQRLGREADSERWLAEAAAQDRGACFHRLFLSTALPPSETPEDRAAVEAELRSPRYHADFIGGAERCAALPDGGALASGDGVRVDVSGRFVRALRAAAAAGDDEATALLDGLRAEGVFQRHPRLDRVGRADGV